MTKNLFSIKALLASITFCFAFTTFAFSQTWTVGVPVSMNLSTLGHAVGGCFPAADFIFTIPGSKVTGVNHYAVVTAIPANSVYITPGNDTLAFGDSILLPSNTNTISVYCFGGSGFCNFDFYAAGTPTTAGQTYPCAANMFWMSNLLLCEEGLSLNLPPNCSVLPGASSIDENNLASFNISLPSASNNYLLSIAKTVDIASASITGMKGEKIVFINVQQGGTETLKCDELKNGFYFLNIVTKNNATYSKKFFLNKE